MPEKWPTSQLFLACSSATEQARHGDKRVGSWVVGHFPAIHPTPLVSGHDAQLDAFGQPRPARTPSLLHTHASKHPASGPRQRTTHKATRQLHFEGSPGVRRFLDTPRRHVLSTWFNSRQRRRCRGCFFSEVLSEFYSLPRVAAWPCSWSCHVTTQN